MNNKDLYDLLSKTDLTDIVPPHFSLPKHKRKRYARKSMKKIMEYEKANFHYTEKAVKLNKQRTLTRLSVCAAVLSLIITMLFNITAVVAFFRNLFYIPGIGITENEYLISAVLEEPTPINANGMNYLLEFATKVKREDGRCEILLFFTSDYFIRQTDTMQISTIIKGKEYIFSLGDIGSGGVGYSYFTATNYDFPDENVFDLKFQNNTTHIVMSELTEEEKKPNLSNEINGITLAAYKYRNNNNVFAMDIITDKTKSDNFSAGISFINLNVYGEDGSKFNMGSTYSLMNPSTNEDYGLGYNFVYFKNSEDRIISKVSVDIASIIYYYNMKKNVTPAKITIPIPEDGETVYTDIKVPVGNLIYELTEVRREGDIIHFEDNCRRYDVPDTQSAIEKRDEYIEFIFMANSAEPKKIYGNEKTITKFNSDDKFIEMEIIGFAVKCYGDFIINFDPNS